MTWSWSTCLGEASNSPVRRGVHRFLLNFKTEGTKPLKAENFHHIMTVELQNNKNYQNIVFEKYIHIQ